MKDIVELLRDAISDLPSAYWNYPVGRLIAAAASEIERLRTFNEMLELDLAEAVHKLAEYENVPVRLRHIMKTGTMPPEDMK